MFRRLSFTARGVGIAIGLVLMTALFAPPASGQGGGPLGSLVAQVTQILDELRNPAHGLAEIKREIRNIEGAVVPPAGPFRRSSGLFGLPSTAHSVDWAVLNNSSVPQTFTMTVYQSGVGLKTVTAPGPLTITLAPGETTHNANSVGIVFHVGFYYEMVIESSTTDVMPSVTIWDTSIAQVIPGTLISPGTWVRLQ